MTVLTETQVDTLLQYPWVADYFEEACGIEPWSSEAQERRGHLLILWGQA